MKVKDSKEYILITRENGDSEESFKAAFEQGLVTLCVGKNTKQINGIKVWKINKEKI